MYWLFFFSLEFKEVFIELLVKILIKFIVNKFVNSTNIDLYNKKAPQNQVLDKLNKSSTKK
jgi:hypothetical protein